ncbi:MAG TPA: SseB family protein [Candidatus Limivivens intestinipullorum]|uniref:SseB family protein n=1 Tax=Candidatus Limivivens intestinipullorum TaxID=2840858 RepID=A0A9D1EVG5_9FIRM|nr:SseB family protein [Candidatus Limivivens intestinipullorum]
MEQNEKMALLRELKDAKEMFVYVSPCTRMPFVYCDPESFDDEVLLFRSQETAKEASKDFLEKKIPLQLAKLENNQFLAFYSSLYSMGVNELCLDKGSEKETKLQLNELVRRPDDSQIPEGKVRVENPELMLTALYFMQELRKSAKPQITPQVREMEEELMAHFRKGTYIMAVQDKNMVPFLKLKNGDAYQPIFTDIGEFQKFNREKKFRTVVVPYAKLSAIVQSPAKGICINPNGVNIILPTARI